LVEQRPEKPRVRSSILRLGTISFKQFLDPKLPTEPADENLFYDVALNEVKDLVYRKHRNSSLRSE
jgi:hypothetical protein